MAYLGVRNLLVRGFWSGDHSENAGKGHLSYSPTGDDVDDVRMLCEQGNDRAGGLSPPGG